MPTAAPDGAGGGPTHQALVMELVRQQVTPFSPGI